MTYLKKTAFKEDGALEMALLSLNEELPFHPEWGIITLDCEGTRSPISRINHGKCVRNSRVRKT